MIDVNRKSVARIALDHWRALAAVVDLVGTAAAVLLQVLGDGKGRRVQGVLEDREYGPAVAVIDGVIPPLACGDPAAVER